MNLLRSTHYHMGLALSHLAVIGQPAEVVQSISALNDFKREVRLAIESCSFAFKEMGVSSGVSIIDFQKISRAEIMDIGIEIDTWVAEWTGVEIRGFDGVVKDVGKDILNVVLVNAEKVACKLAVAGILGNLANVLPVLALLPPIERKISEINERLVSLLLIADMADAVRRVVN